MKSTAKDAIPKLHRVVELFFMLWFLQEKLQVKLIDLRAFSKSHDLALAISSPNDINTIVATYRKCNKI